jgi:translation initiation factor 2 gamma subunit (eIF-2gamma)
VIDDYKLVINKGSEDGIREGQRMLVYRVSDEEIEDPNTGESLGYLELVRGTGKIIFVQDKLSIIESDKTKKVTTTYNRNHAFYSTYQSETVTENERIPFENPQVGDQVKPI